MLHTAPAPQARAPHQMSRHERSTASWHLLVRSRKVRDPAERDRLVADVITLNADVAEALAARYRNRGIPDEDLCQAAYEGLVKAVRRFDPTLEHDLLSYAVPTIRGQVQRYFRDQGWSVRPPRRLQDLQWRLHRAVGELSQELGHEPTSKELAEALGVAEHEVDEARQAYGSFAPASLDRPVGEPESPSRGDLLPADDHEIDAAEARLVIAPVVRTLPERDRRILYLRFCEDLTQEEIGQRLGVTQMQVSRLLARILGRLRREIGDREVSRSSGRTPGAPAA